MKDNKQTQSDVAMSIEEQAYGEKKYKPALKFNFNHQLQSTWMDCTGVDEFEDKAKALESKMSGIIQNLEVKTKSRLIEAFFEQCTQEEIEMIAIQGLLAGLG